MSGETLKKQSSSLSSRSSSLECIHALHTLQSPDGYYTYLQIPKPPQSTHKSLLSSPSPSTDGKGRNKNENDDTSETTIDKTKIEKNYRKLSLKLHPDRPGGDAETFRMLERAKCVLMSDKLRKEYDLLGLDLEEEDHQDDNGTTGTSGGKGGGQDDADGDHDGEKKADTSSSTAGNNDSVISHMASATVAGILQLAVRTAMMAVVSLFLSRFKYTTYPSILFMLYTSFQIHKARKDSPHMITMFDISSPMIIGVGILFMYYGRVTPPLLPPLSESDGIPQPPPHTFWSWTFWTGETLVMTMFALNTLTGREHSILKPSLPLIIAFYIGCSIITLIIRGKTWRYLTALALDIILALVAVLIFPIMEMILEEIMNDKLRKVGDKVRQYSKTMEQSYKIKLDNLMMESIISNNDNDKVLNVPSSTKGVEID